MSKGCRLKITGGARCSKPVLDGKKYCIDHVPKVKGMTYSIGKTTFNGEKTVKTSEYDKYLQSEEWKNKSSYEKQQNPNCSICNRKGVLHVHHRTYVRCGKEEKHDLIVLCSDCHKLFHDHYKYDGRVGYFKPQ